MALTVAQASALRDLLDALTVAIAQAARDLRISPRRRRRPPPAGSLATPPPAPRLPRPPGLRGGAGACVVFADDGETV